MDAVRKTFEAVGEAQLDRALADLAKMKVAAGARGKITLNFSIVLYVQG